MQWNHLPVAGGLYDQHPQLLEDFLYIFTIKSKYEKEKMDKEQRETKNSRSGRVPKKSRGRRH